MNKKQKNIRRKKVIIIMFCIIALFLTSAILTVTVISSQRRNVELSKKNSNILYYSENENKVKEENVLVVGIDEKNETNEENPNTNNEVNESSNNIVKPQPKEIPYYIKVNNQANVVTIYKKDSNGKYTVPVKAMVCSIGDATPESGVFTMSDKYTWRLLQGDVYGQYACRITGHILFHSVPYEKQDKSTLEWWEYDKLGTKASLGCIRLKVEDAKWIYDNCIAGTKVEFYSSSNPGPLGKPTSQKITDDEEVRNWDPTDPDAKNPWKDYLKRKEEESKETTVKPEDNSELEENTENTKNNNTNNEVENNDLNNTPNNKEENKNVLDNNIVVKVKEN